MHLQKTYAGGGRRKELGMMQGALAAMVYTSRASIGAYEEGRSVILADRIDEVAEDIHQFLLQQTPCKAQGGQKK